MICTDESTCCQPRAGRPLGTVIFGLGLLAFGLLLTVDNLGLLYAGDYLRFWPVLLVLFGISHLLQPPAARRIGAGVAWIVAGIILLTTRLDLIDIDLWDLWPLILVYCGISLMWRAVQRRQAVPGDAADTFHAVAILGGTERRITADSFRGGHAIAMLGACVIDLRDGACPRDTAVIDVFALWGGVEIRVPQDWEVQVKGAAILGGMEDKTSTADGASKKLIVRGTAIMGGVEIKN